MKKIYESALKYKFYTEYSDYKELNKFMSEFKIDCRKTPWCAAFVGSCLSSNGHKNTGNRLARSYLKWGVQIKLNEIQIGDIVVLKRGKEPWQGHVAFYAGSHNKSVILLLGGNQNNSVCEKFYLLEDVLGVRRIEK